MKTLLSILSFLLLVPVVACAQEATSERTTAIAVGATNTLDTYLSPLEYKGTNLRFISSTLRGNGKTAWDKQFTHEGELCVTHNRADNADAIAGHYDFAFAMMHRWQLLDNRLTLRVGGMAELFVGFAYNMRNAANNPAQAYASLAVGAAGTASYNVRIGSYSFPVSYEVRLPLLGAMFSPAYGQSYYEIFSRGEYDHNVVLTTVGTPCLRHQLTVSVPMGKSGRTAFKVGYLGDVRQATPNHLKQHTYSHSVVLGIAKKL